MIDNPTTASDAGATRGLTLRHYQQRGVDFLVRKKRAILADAPGLGKTLQGAVAAKRLGERTTISCPLHLVDQWAEFLEAQFDEPVFVAAYGDIIKRDRALKQYEAQQGPKWLIVNTDALSRLYLPDSDTFLIDEAHYYRNRDAERSQGAFRYAQRCENVICLTATPIYKDVGDLFHVLKMLDPKKWTSFWNFIDSYAVTMSRGGYGLKVLRRKNIDILDSKLRDYMLSRSYRDVGMELPQLIEKNIVLRMSPPEMKRYQELVNNYRLDGEVFFNASSVLHKMRQVTLLPEKITAIKSIIDDKQDNKPVIVFCWYKETAATLADALGAELITGDIAPRDRRVRASTSHRRVRVITMESLSDGVDLSESRTVIYAEESYVPGQIYQTLSRVRRASHDITPVELYWVRFKGTVDEVVHAAVKRRISDAHTILREALS